MRPILRNRKSSNSSSHSFRPGDRIRATDSFGHHSYQPARIYTVTEVDSNDNTLRARDTSGEIGNWIKWRDCSLAQDIGFDWLKTVLPAEALDILSAFDGLEYLSLREEIRNQLVLQIPNLKERILEVQAQQEEALHEEAEEGDDLPEVEAF